MIWKCFSWNWSPSLISACNSADCGSPVSERLPNDLVHEVIPKDLHHRSIDRGLGQREHLLQTFIHQSDVHLAIRDQNTLDHAGQDSPQTEIFVRDVSRDFSLSPRNLFQILVNFPHDPGTRNRMRKRSVLKQMPDFARARAAGGAKA